MKLMPSSINLILTLCVLFASACGSGNKSSDKADRRNQVDSVAIIPADNPVSDSTHSTKGTCCIKLDIDRMNSIYRGIRHSFLVTANPGASVTCRNGELIAGEKEGEFSILAREGEESAITVKQSNGCEQTYNLRLKKIPDPVIYMGTIKGSGQMTKGELNGQNGIFARMENFDFDVRFRVVSFVLTMNMNGVYVEKRSEGPGITAEMKSMLAGTKPGNKVLIEQVKVQGPDSLIRNIPGVILTVR